MQHLNIDERASSQTNSSDHYVTIWMAQRRPRPLSDNAPVVTENNTDTNY
ncbi:Uncharacterised protein [Serratia plymuthica]|nr:Uncharacterised protein [Serratia plymuthica]